MRVPISQLSRRVTPEEAVERCYGAELDQIAQAALAQQSVLLEVDSDAHRLVAAAVKRRCASGPGLAPCVVVADAAAPGTTIDLWFKAFQAAVTEVGQARASNANAAAVLLGPHFDVIAHGDGNGRLEGAAREVLALLRSSALDGAAFVGLVDPTLPLHRSIRKRFHQARTLVGLPLQAMPMIVTADEALRFDPASFDPGALHALIGELSPVRARALLGSLTRLPTGDPERARVSLEEAVTGARATARVTLDHVAGYESMKGRIDKDVLEPIKYFLQADLCASDRKMVRDSLPIGLLFDGPPGVGKTFLLRAIPASAGLPVVTVAGPELKSMWQGESEHNLRSACQRARALAARHGVAFLVVDELDATVTRRGAGSVTDDAVVSTLLGELQGVRPQAAPVILLASVNNPKRLDPALLARLVLIHVPYPNAEDRRCVLRHHLGQRSLALDSQVLDEAVTLTGGFTDEDHGARFAGRELEMLASKLLLLVVAAGRKHSVSPSSVSITADHVRDAVASMVKPSRLPRVTFESLGGLGSIEALLRDDAIIPFDRYRRGLGPALAARTWLFHGVGGTAKTSAAIAFARALDLPLRHVVASSLKDRWFGASEQAIGEAFGTVKGGGVLLIDEIDCIAGRRVDMVNEVSKSLVGQLLGCLDELLVRPDTFFVATTNVLSELDPALLRRMDRKIAFLPPDQAARREILDVLATRHGLDLGADERRYIARRTSGILDPATGLFATGASLDQVVRALTRLGRHPTRAEIDRVLGDIYPALGGAPLSQQDRRVVAVHELGHAVAELTLGVSAAGRVEVSILPVGGSLGRASVDASGGVVMGAGAAWRMLTVLLAGRAAELVFFREASAGAADDVRRAREVVERIVVTGLDSALGLLPADLDRLGLGREVVLRRMAELLAKAAEEAEALVRTHGERLAVLAERLIVEGELVLTAQDLRTFSSEAGPVPVRALVQEE